MSRADDEQDLADRLTRQIADLKTGPWTVDLTPMEQIARDAREAAARHTPQPTDQP
jgi:hypothetical protein